MFQYFSIFLKVHTIMKSILTGDTLEPFFIPFDEAPEEVWGGAGVEVMVVSILQLTLTHGQGEDDGGVLLSRDLPEGLKIPGSRKDMCFRWSWHLSWRAAGEVEMMSEASFKARLDFCSPSAAIT